MTCHVFRSRRAEIEVEEIAEYLTAFSLPAAHRFLQALEQAQQHLSEYPDSGAPGTRPGTRRIVIGDYILFYRRRGPDVEIFAVRHARRRDSRF
jgi:addiction module RelE/StbE family toxin